MSIRAVLWDLGGVILRTEDDRGRRRWEASLGLNPGQLERLVFECDASRAATLGRASANDVWTSVLTALGLPEGERQALSQDFFAGDRIDDRLVNFIRGLRPAYKTGLITNAWPNVRRWIEDEWRLSQVFDTMVISAEVGLAKPDPRIYRLGLDRLGVAPGEALFIDDFPENVTGAVAVGLHGIRFESTDQVLADVQRRLEGDG
ncbi:MAG: HAD family phosphatase [Chloroflexota bacterium]